MRTFNTGATRDNDDTKFDYDGFLSPLVLYRYAQYMTKHRKQADGSMRASDNWQKGIPVDTYRKSLWRHFFDVWAILRGWVTCVGQSEDPEPTTLEDSLCAVIFNASGLLHEVIKARKPITTFHGVPIVLDDNPDRFKCTKVPVPQPEPGVDADLQVDWFHTVPQSEPVVDLVSLCRAIAGVQTDPSRLLPKPKTCGDCLYWEAKKGVPGSGCLSCPGANITDVACKTFHPKEGE